MHHKHKSDRDGSHLCFIILVHYYSTVNNDYRDILLEEVRKGNLPPKDYASLNDFMVMYGKNLSKKQHFNQWHRDVNPDNRDSINKNRMSLGLETYEEMRLKEERNKEIYRKGLTRRIKLGYFWM
jgi:hypothetical protein